MNPRLRAVAIAVWACVAAFACLELGLRATSSSKPSFYDVMSTTGEQDRHLEYPFGSIELHGPGVADDLPSGDRPVEAWMGDSVLYGVGCGAGFRLTEVLEAADPSVEQLNLGVPGFSALDNEWQKALRLSLRWHARRVSWLLNLNDVSRPGDRPGLTDGWGLPKPPLAERSYLFAAPDSSVRSWRFRAEGADPLEMWPHRDAAAFDATAERIHGIVTAFHDSGLQLTVLVLPYEMQVSADAARFYKDAGVRWEDGFLDGSPQQALAERLHGDIVDLRPAFLANKRREDIPLGAYYVAVEGGRLDWDHLNREGHAALGRWLVENKP